MADKTSTMKTKLEIDGEKAYKDACQSINTSLKTLGSEMRLVTAQYADNAQSVDALKAKQETLKKVFEEQAKKVGEAEKALKLLRDEGLEETNPTVQKFQQNLNHAKAALLNTENQIRATETALKDSQSPLKAYEETTATIDGTLKTLGTELDLVTAQYADNASGADALRAKQEVLQKTLTEQNKKVSEAEKALAQLKDEGFDDTNPAVQEFQQKLNSAKTEAAKTETQLKDVNKELNTSKTNWDAVGGAVAKGAKAFAAGVAAISVAAGALAVKIGKEVVEAFGELEQNLGGSEAVFGDYAEAIQKAGEDAYKNLGISQSEYLATANKMGALFQGSGIEQQKSLDLTQQAMQRAADMASVMGIDMASAMEAVTGAAKGNFTMMDNLGVSMNATSIQAYAAANGLDFIWEKASQAEKAEVAMQMFFESTEQYAGNFARESTQTISGSLGLLEAAMSSFTAGLGNADADMQKLTNNVADAFGAVVKNITPVINNIVKALPVAFDALSDALTEMLPTLLNTVTELFEQVLKMVVTLLPNLIPVATEAVMTIVTTIIENIPLLLDGAAQMVAGLADGISAALPELLPKAVEAITALVQTLIKNIPMLIDAALQLIMGLAEGLIAAIPVLVEAIPEIITSLVAALLAAIPQIIQAGIQLITSLVGALPEIITAIVAAIPEIINGIITAVIESIPLIIQAGIDLLIALIQALPEIITTIVGAIPQIIGGIVDALIGNIDKIIMAGVQLFIALIENLPTIIIEIVKAVPQIITGIVDAFGSLAYKLVEAGGNLLKGLWEGISGAASWLWEKVSGWASGLVDGIKNFFGIHSPSTVFAEIGDNMAAGIGVGFGDEMGGVGNDMSAAVAGAGAVTAQEAIAAINNGIMSNIALLDNSITAIVERVLTQITAQNARFTNQGVEVDKNLASGMVTGIVQTTAKVLQITTSIINAFIAQNAKFTNQGIELDKNIASGMVSGIPQITAKIPQIITPILEAINSYAQRFVEAGENMVKGIWQGFQNMSAWLESRVRAMMEDIVAAVEDEMDIASPSKVFAGVGEFMAAGIGVGFEREMRKVERNIRKAMPTEVLPENDPAPYPAPSGRIPRGEDQSGGVGGVQVVQNFYTEGNDYAKQQREAAKQFKLIAREIG